MCAHAACRPLDVLAVMLEERGAPQRVAAFFEAYGAVEASAMCVALASSPPGTTRTVRTLGKA